MAEELRNENSKLKRINLLGVPVDVCNPGDMDEVILEILAKPGTKQIVFLSVWDLLKGRKKKKNFSKYLHSADLILPVSKSIIWGAKFLKKTVPVRYNPFYKASPSLVIVSDGIKEKKLWAYNRRNNFASSIFLYYKDCIGIFSDRVKRVSEKTFDRGLEIWAEIFKNPLKIFLIFPYLRYIILVFWYRLFKKNS